jgi:hypothetical protein
MLLVLVIHGIKSGDDVRWKISLTRSLTRWSRRTGFLAENPVGKDGPFKARTYDLGRSRTV